MLAATLNGAAGRGFVLLALLSSVGGFIVTVNAVRSRNAKLLASSSRYAWLILAGAVGAFAVMERALVTRDFSLEYVQQVGSRSTPALYNVTAAWSALEGSILLWVLVLAGYTAAIAYRFRSRRHDALVGWALAVMYAVCAFFTLLSFGPANPFRLGAPGVADGPGPNPLLQNHLLVLFHPPILYLGYVGMTVPFAFAIAALITGRVGEGWLVETRRWALFAWGFLTVGIILGGWWSYEVLGWSGVWGWDPVENASLLPWLTGTAYIHSVMVQERRGMLRVWNLSLLVATFSLTILGTFLTRSGVLKSVHSFTESPIGPYLLVFFGLVVLVSVGLIGWRGDRLRSPGAIDSPVSREGAFLANNVIFSVFAFVVLLGTVFPLLVEALQGREIAVGAPFFDRMSMPLGIVLLFLMAIAPVLPWRKASGELLRDRLFWPAWCGVGALGIAVVAGAGGLAPLVAFALAGFAGGAAVRQLVIATRRQGWRGLVGRTNGGMMVHLGIIVIAVALAASNSYSHSREFVMNEGDTVRFSGHSFTFEGFSFSSTERDNATSAMVRIDGDQVYAPAVHKFRLMGQDVGTPSVRTSFTKDLYLTLESPVRTETGQARIKIFVKPLVLWLWIGGGITVFGTLLAAFPGRRRRGTDPVSAPVEHPVQSEPSPLSGELVAGA